MVLLVSATIDIAMGFDPDQGFMPVTGVVNLLHLIPTLAVTVRRLHDIDRSGWWLLISFVPVVGLVVLVVFLCMSSVSSSRFGPSSNAGNGEAQAAMQGAAHLDQLEKLAALRASGAIDEAEFNRVKADVLARSRT